LSRDAGQEAGMNGDADPVLSRDAGQEGRMRGDADPEITADASPGRQGAEPIPENRQGKPVILELGTSLGISTLALALGAPHRRVITVEGCPELAAIARDNLQRHGAINTEVICGEFSDALSLLRKRDTKIGMAFIDGNHRGPALAGYVKKIREMGDEMIIVADDIRLNREMIRAWELLTADTTAALNATASLETFRFGILFFLPNLTPGRYRIRY
ncbi:MAG: class I SAM-dependent methyltransferase, partial [Bacteroidales bacterium]|nr:class I SAM-dependent methyltransferase [Bacteroidales bacterium]